MSGFHRSEIWKFSAITFSTYLFIYCAPCYLPSLRELQLHMYRVNNLKLFHNSLIFFTSISIFVLCIFHFFYSSCFHIFLLNNVYSFNVQALIIPNWCIFLSSEIIGFIYRNLFWDCFISIFLFNICNISLAS